MADLPAGTITFLYTDIEGSTRLVQVHPDAMMTALARHRAILQQAVESHDGYVFRIIGGAFCAAFATAPDALKAALAAQRTLHTEPWSESGPVRLRMGLHTGVAQVRPDDVEAGQYSGYIAMARPQRIMSAGHGDDLRIVNHWIKSGEFDYVLHGHTLRRRDEKIGRTHVVNPGTLSGPRQQKHSGCLIDLATDEVKFIEIQK